MQFEIERGSKRLVFDSDLRGLKVNGLEYISGRDGVLIYDKTRDVQAKQVESQNNITFYWDPSKLAAFYNRFSTDELEYKDREPVIRQAVEFLCANTDSLPLGEEFLTRMLEPCKLLGFYQGFPIFDSSVGFAKLQSRLGIHMGTEDVMISTPLDRYESDVYELAELISKETGLPYSKKKNRVIFPNDPNLLAVFGLQN